MKTVSTPVTAQSVSRALGILSCFSDQHPELRVTDVARMLGLTLSNVSRLMATMEGLGYLERNDGTGLFRPGLNLVTLAGIALNGMEIRKHSLAELHDLEIRLGLGANLAILRDDAIFYVGHVDGPRAPRMYTLLGRHNPLHATGMGKVLLAHLSASEQTRILQSIEMRAYTTFTITQREVLQAQLDHVRSVGFATEREELALGRACVAAPIRDRSGAVIAAVSISGPLSELNLEERLDALSGIVIEAGDRISVRMGYIAAVMQ